MKFKLEAENRGDTRILYKILVGKLQKGFFAGQVWT
jgi:hypothetical protein